LAANFLEYFDKHEEKVIRLYYDRSGNNLKRAGVDYASQLKEAIEYKFELDESGQPLRRGKRTGWRVQLMSLNQGNIGQAEEYGFMQELFSGSNRKLPEILIDRYQCKPLKASREGGRTKIGVNKAGTPVTTKQRKPEQL